MIAPCIARIVWRNLCQSIYMKSTLPIAQKRKNRKTAVQVGTVHTRNAIFYLSVMLDENTYNNKVRIGNNTHQECTTVPHYHPDSKYIERQSANWEQYTRGMQNFTSPSFWMLCKDAELMIVKVGMRKAYEPPMTDGKRVPNSVCNRVLIPVTKSKVWITLTLSFCNKSIAKDNK